MNNIIYVKKVDEYDDILKKEHHKFPKFIKKVIFMYKNMFNIITKRKVENEDIWILPVQEKYLDTKINKIVKKMATLKDNTYVISKDLENSNFRKIMDKYSINYINGEELKKYLIIKILEYINNIQNEEMSKIEVAILTNDISEFNIYLVEKLSKLVKNIKIVSPNIYKFKNLEEKLYNEYGIAIQFSNSYKKSLAKAKIIVNLNFNQIDINEYEIFDKAIIINVFKENIKIKSKLFNGIIVNSCNIKLKKEIRDKFKNINIYHKYNNIALYESNLHNEKRIENIFIKLEDDKVAVSNLIGNSGIINKKEFKNIFKKLDK